MSPHAWISLTTTILVFAGLQRHGMPADLLFLAGLALVTLTGVISTAEALQGFANPAVITIGALFVVAAAMRATGALDLVGDRILGKARDERTALQRLAIPAVGVSALMNNTPLVAMLVPVVLDWCRKHRISPSRLLIPVSYLAIMGGTCTLIGTSTNLVVHGLLVREHDVLSARLAAGEIQDASFVDALRGMHMFEIGYVGLPCAVIGSCYLVLVGRRLLPNRTELIEQLGEKRREYTVEMEVLPECKLVGQTVEAAGLRHLPGLFLIEIDRNGDVITPAEPTDVIHAHDRLVFAGVVSTIVDLEKIPGLKPAADSTYIFQDQDERLKRRLTEAVLSNVSPVIGKTVRESSFRQQYNAAIVAVHRGGRRVLTKIGNIRLEPGDTLLLQTRSDFVETWRNSPDFYLVSSVEGSRPRRHDRVGSAFLLMGLLVVLLGISSWIDRSGTFRGFSSPAIISLTVAGLMVAARCLSMAEARAAIDLPVLVTIGAALGLGYALDESGAARYIAQGLVNLVGAGNPWLLLAVVYVFTVVFTELITNTAVAALMFPLAIQVAYSAGMNPRPFVMAIALAASSSFITPVGYQTNLMVMGPGGYRPGDYLRVGLPLTCLVATTAILLIPFIWPF